MMKASMRWGTALALAALCLCWLAQPAAAAEADPYQYNPALSLIGGCGTSSVDPVADPGCPGGSHPPAPFHITNSVAVDSYGDEYVASYGSDGTEGRIDIFDPEGFFIGELSDPHGPESIAVDSKGNLYAYEGPQESASYLALYAPKRYEPGAGKIEYGGEFHAISTGSVPGTGTVAIDPTTDRVYVTTTGEGGSIEELGSAAEGNPPLSTIASERLHSPTVVGVDGKRRRVFASSCKESGVFECEVLVFEADAPHALIEEIDGSTTPGGVFTSNKGLISTAVDEETGLIFVTDLEKTPRIVEFDEDFNYVATIGPSGRAFLEDPFVSQIAVGNADLNPEAANRHLLFIPVSSINIQGEAFAFEPSNVTAPTVEGLAAVNISEREAELRATLDPGAAETHYVFELEEEGSGEPIVVGEGTVSKESLPTPVIAPVSGLTPATSYRFRLTATNVKGSGEEAGGFTTYADAPASGACANENLRLGLSSSLPDCRAYELVTPPDTNDRPVRGGEYPGENTFSTPLSSPAGDAVTFITEGGSLPGSDGAGALGGDRYRSVRGTTGWSTGSAGPSGTEAETPNLGSTSSDQGYGFWEATGQGSAVIGGFRSLTNYLEYPDGHSEPIGRGSEGIDPAAIGELITEDAGHVIFQTRNLVKAKTFLAQQLEPNAPPEGTAAVYDRTPDGVTHVVSLLPGNATPAAGEDASYLGASHDGAGVAFEIGETLYLRVDDEATYEIGPGLTYAGVSEGGKRIFYVEGGNLYAFDTDTDERIQFTDTGNAVVVNVARDGTRAYFVSTTKITTRIAAAGANPNGETPKSGKQNLYVSEGGDIHFVATVTEGDVIGEPLPGSSSIYNGLGLWTTEAEAGVQAARDPSRLDPSGSVFVFQSRARIDGFGPSASPRIYRYDLAANSLQCISCIPTGIGGGGGAELESLGGVQTAAPPFGPSAFVPSLTPDGRRVVFESKEALVSTDSDGVQDVYEWEETGVGSCTRPGGCVYLISSGHSARDNYLYAMSRSADDVFFLTADTLVPGDTQTPSIYDARVGGGFDQPVEDRCSGEGCRPQITPPPAIAAPTSEKTGAKDNVKKHLCPKGRRKVKRRGEVRCVKKHRRRHRHHRRSSAGRQIGGVK